MPKYLSFTQYLWGHATSKRTPFYIAYAVLWAHWIVASALAVLSIEQDLVVVISSIGLASLSVGLATYGLFTRQYILLVNALCYVSTLGFLAEYSSTALGLCIVSAITGLTSCHFLIYREFSQYKREIGIEHTRTVMPVATGLVGVSVLLLFALGIGILY